MRSHSGLPRWCSSRHMLPILGWLFLALASCSYRSAEAPSAPAPEGRAAAGQEGGEAETRPGTVLVFSDLHFDPFADKALVWRLEESAAEAWPALFANAPGASLPAYGENTNYALLFTTLEEMQRIAPEPDLILVTGDFLVHDFYDGFAESLGEDAPGREAFLNKTLNFLTSEIHRRWPATPILPVMGNNDSRCGNYSIEPRGEFLSWLEKDWGALLHDERARTSFARTFQDGGHYVVDAPDGTHRLIVLNTVFLSRLYQNKCGDPASDPVEELFIFLETELERARSDGRGVWLIFHIPPGIDTFQTLRRARKNPSSDGTIEPVFFWQEEIHQRFEKLVSAHGETILASIAAHIHRNSFQLFGYDHDARSAESVVRIVPAISPVYNNNPAFKVFYYNRQTAELLDYEVFRLDLEFPFDGFTLEHRFQDSYGQPALDAASHAKIYGHMLDDTHGLGTLYRRHHSISIETPEIDAETWALYWTTIGHLDSKAFVRGLEAAETSSAP